MHTKAALLALHGLRCYVYGNLTDRYRVKCGDRVDELILRYGSIAAGGSFWDIDNSADSKSYNAIPYTSVPDEAWDQLDQKMIDKFLNLLGEKT